MKPLLAKPWFWFLPQALLLLGLFLGSERYKVEVGVSDSDAETFRKTSEYSFLDYLRESEFQPVPFGYPQFLRWVRTFSPDYRAAPACHLLLHFAGVLVYFAGLRRILKSEWLAFGAASSLLYSNLILLYGNELMTDSLASSLAIAAVGCLFLIARDPTHVVAWIGLTLCVTCGYHVRAAYLFLIPLVPLLGVVLGVMLLPHEQWRRYRLGLAAGLLAVGVVPFLAYSMLRWQMNGHFGYMSISDFGLFGLTGQALDEDLVPELPEEVRPLALRLIGYRDAEMRLHLGLLKAEGTMSPDEGMAADGPEDSDEKQPSLQKILGKEAWTAVLHQISAHIGSLDPGALNDLYHRTYDLWLEVALHNYTSTLLAREANLDMAQLSKLNSAILRLRPREYLKKVAATLRMGVAGVLFNSYVANVLMAVLVALLAAWHILFLFWRWWNGPDADALPSARSAPEHLFAIHLFLLVAGTFALASIAQLSLVAMATFRYTDAAGVFLPTVLVAAIFLLWGKIRLQLPTTGARPPMASPMALPDKSAEVAMPR